MYFASAVLTMLATIATVVFLPPVVALVPMVIWIIVMTVIEWCKYNGGRHAARRRGTGEEEEESR